MIKIVKSKTGKKVAICYHPSDEKLARKLARQIRNGGEKRELRKTKT